MKESKSPVPIGHAPPGYNIDNSAWTIPKLRFVAGGYNLELQDEILIKRSCGSL
jgi:hypothetical protein